MISIYSTYSSWLYHKAHGSRPAHLFRCAVLFASFFVALCFADTFALGNDINSEALFKRGLARFQQGQYVSARLDFNEIINRYPDSLRLHESYVMLSKTLFNLGDYSSAMSIISEFRNKHPESKHMDWTVYFLAACKYKSGSIDEALVLLASLAKNADDTDLRQRSLQRIRTHIVHKSSREAVEEVLGTYGLSLSAMNSAKVPEKPKINAEPSPEPIAEWKPGSELRIGLLAPLTGANEIEGYDLRTGVESALERYPDINGMPLRLIVEDTASNPVQAVLKTRELINRGVVAIIGPVFSESTLPSAMEANAHNIPFIAPTATDVGITQIGPCIFQINQTPITQAHALAGFIHDELGLLNTAVISGNDWWGRALTATYKEQYESKGGTIIASEVFEPGVNRYDYNEMLMRIRAAAPEGGSQPDSMLVVDYGNAFPDTIIVKPDPETMPQRLQPVHSIDCVLISALPEDAVNIVRQIRDYHIDAVLVGDSGWNDERVAIDLESAGNGAFLISTSVNVNPNLGSDNFVDDFESKKNALASISSRKGYDAAAILIHTLLSGATSPNALVEALSSLTDFNGISSRYTIDSDTHINTAIDFVQMQNGMLVKLNNTVPVTPDREN